MAASSAAPPIGSLHQDPSINAQINIDELLNKHFAILGTTGVGKSSGVAIVLQQILAVETGPANFSGRSA